MRHLHIRSAYSACHICGEVGVYNADHEGNEDGSNRDVPPFDNDPRTDAEIKQEVYDRMDNEDYFPTEDEDGW